MERIGKVAMGAFLATFLGGGLLMLLAAYSLVGIEGVREEGLQLLLVALCVAPAALAIAGWRALAARLSRTRLMSVGTFAGMTCCAVAFAGAVGLFLARTSLVFDTPLFAQGARYALAQQAFLHASSAHASLHALDGMAQEMASIERDWSMALVLAFEPLCLSLMGLSFGYVRATGPSVRWIKLGWGASMVALFTTQLLYLVVVGAYVTGSWQPVPATVLQGGLLFGATPWLVALQLALVALPLGLSFGAHSRVAPGLEVATS